ncbi:conserved protein of unknown function [Ectopseudomonas oleovorans]|uniref:Uncharacterized protein n=1 Tax=Ectopseudomonas oleovorans TaxID=301 RepID=A0A653AYF7_ECTOL|nr:conserved protein of unknown function [Pseudomonas oleovorans]
MHTLGSPLPFMGEGLGERAENAAKRPVSPSPNAARPNPLPKGARGLIVSDHFLCEQRYGPVPVFSFVSAAAGTSPAQTRLSSGACAEDRLGRVLPHTNRNRRAIDGP